MQLIQGTRKFKLDKPCAAAIGKFDGIHRGHQKLLENIIKQKEKGILAAVFTFDPPPAVFFGGAERRWLTTKEEKRRIFKRLGIDVLIEFPLTEETAEMPPQQFIEEILIGQMNTIYLSAGADVTFGRGGEGDRRMLSEYGKRFGYTFEIVDKIREEGGMEISSSLIRRELEEGKMRRVSELIGFPYSVTGTVVHGKKLGRVLGMPTVNLLPPPDKLLPPNGVYFSNVSYGGKHYKSISNIGCKPTVSEERKMGVETYLYDFAEDIYGKEIIVNLLDFKRAEKKFSDVEQLKEQMQKDIEEGRKFSL